MPPKLRSRAIRRSKRKTSNELNPVVRLTPLNLPKIIPDPYVPYFKSFNIMNASKNDFFTIFLFRPKKKNKNKTNVQIASSNDPSKNDSNQIVQPLSTENSQSISKNVKKKKSNIPSTSAIPQAQTVSKTAASSSSHSVAQQSQIAKSTTQIASQTTASTDSHLVALQSQNESLILENVIQQSDESPNRDVEITVQEIILKRKRIQENSSHSSKIDIEIQSQTGSNEFIDDGQMMCEEFDSEPEQEDQTSTRNVWNLECTFKSEQYLMNYLEQNGSWAKRGTDKVTGKIRWRCNLDTTIGPQCNAKKYLFSVSTKIGLSVLGIVFQKRIML